MTSYLAGVIGTTSFSFGGNIGIYYHAMSRVPWGSKELPRLPKEYECQARLSLQKRLSQTELPRPDVWYVRTDGNNLEAVLDDVRKALVDQALPWLSLFSKLDVATTAFETRPENFSDDGILIEILGGIPGSFARAGTASALAFALGQKQRAIQAWQVVLQNPYYDHIEEMRQQAREYIEWLSNTSLDSQPPNPRLEPTWPSARG